MRLWLVLALLVPLAGCLGDSEVPADDSDADDVPAESPADDQDSDPGPDDEPADEGRPPRPPANRTETQPLVEQVAIDRWRATQWVNISNDHALPRAVNVEAGTFEGLLSVVGEPRDDYRLSALLFGEGATASEAEAALGRVLFQAEDVAAGNRVALIFQALFSTAGSGPVALSGDERSGADLSLRVPQSTPEVRIATTGHLIVNGLGGELVASVEGSADLSGSWSDLQATTEGGDLELAFDPARTGTSKVAATARGANLTVELVERASLGYDIAARSRGVMSFDLQGVEMEQQRTSARGRSAGFADADHQATVQLSGSNIAVTSV
ncbi:MAG: hypothetical protein ACPGQL_02775 [Thermoplasmatota archaeon]